MQRVDQRRPTFNHLNLSVKHIPHPHPLNFGQIKFSPDRFKTKLLTVHLINHCCLFKVTFGNFCGCYKFLVYVQDMLGKTK